MNVIYKHFKCTPTITGNLLHFTKSYATQKLPVTWIPAPRISCISKEKSGDKGLDLGVTSDDYMYKVAESKELQNADELVKKMFTLGFNRRSDLNRVKRGKAAESVRRHDHDYGSTESTIARMTVQILQLQEHQEKFRNNVKTKVMLKELIEKRKRLLKILRDQDYPRFEFLLKRLNIVYHPFQEDNPRTFRKYCTRRLLQKYCDELKEKKLKAYREELESQQKDFFREKAEKLEFIRNEEIAFGVIPTVTEEEINAAKQKAESSVK